MFGKPVVLVLGVLGLSLVSTFGSRPVSVATVTGKVVHSDTLIGTVEIESLKVISIVDDAGRELPPDSTLVPPVPIRGVSEVRLVFRGPQRPEPLAARVRRP